MRFFSSGSEIVDQVGQMSIVGNMIPSIWYKTIVNEKGKTQYLAITILADIVYWYKPEEVRDERSGMVIGWKKKFKADFLQRTLKSLVDEYDENERTILRALSVLEDLKVIRRHRRTIRFKSGIIARNVLFIELVPEVLYELTYPKKEAIRKRIKVDSAESEPYEILEEEVSGSGGQEEGIRTDENNDFLGESTKMKKRTDKNENMDRQKWKSEPTNLSVHSAENVSSYLQNCQSTSAELSVHFAKNVDTNTENTVENNTDHSIYPFIGYGEMDGENCADENPGMILDAEMRRTAYRRLIAQNIEYDWFMEYGPFSDREMFHQLYETMCDVVCVPRDSIRIQGVDYPYAVVQSQFLKLKRVHLEYAMMCLKGVGHKAALKAYQISTLYNAPMTMSLYYSQLANYNEFGIGREE